LFLGLAAASAAVGWVAASRDELVLYLFLVFPVLKAEGAWGAASVMLALTAFVVLLIDLRYEVDTDEGVKERSVSAGGVLLIGPIPIVFGTDRRIAIMALMAAVAVMAALLLLLIF
jgi:uncharacterized protein (TIGR00304 family)